MIFSLLSLWLVLFMFFGILFLEVFSLTKWNTAETRDQNYSTLGTSLVMLAFMTSGCVPLAGCRCPNSSFTQLFSEGWNQYMHD